MYYKVVRKHSETGVLISATGLLLPPAYQVTYTPGKWTEPRQSNSWLFVFSNLNEARSFYSPPSEQIWECEVANELFCPPVLLDFADLGSDRQTTAALTRFWQTRDIGMVKGWPAPETTRVFQRVKLVTLI